MVGPPGDEAGQYAATKLVSMAQLAQLSKRLFVKAEFFMVTSEMRYAADFTICPSRTEPFGYVDVEFAWHGCPTIGAMVGGLGKVPGIYYRVLEPGDKALIGVAGVFGLISFLTIGAGFLGSPQIFARSLALRSEREVRRGAAVAIVWTVLADTGAVLSGLFGRYLLSGPGDDLVAVPGEAVQEALADLVGTGHDVSFAGSARAMAAGAADRALPGPQPGGCRGLTGSQGRMAGASGRHCAAGRRRGCAPARRPACRNRT